jgi:uncharacterized membrane protein YhhN
MHIYLLTFLVLISASIYIRAEYLGSQLHIYLFKPLTIILILLIATLGRRDKDGRYKALILGGLVASLVGDVLLILPADLFIPGLVAFLTAHLIYFAAFRAHLPSGDFHPWTLIPFGAYGTLMFLYLMPGLGAMSVPVFVYVVVIMAMGWQAFVRWIRLRDRGAALTIIGAILFILSDTVLAINRFRVTFAAEPVLVLTTYYAAQWFFARSVDRHGEL